MALFLLEVVALTKEVWGDTAVVPNATTANQSYWPNVSTTAMAAFFALSNLLS